MSLPLSWLMYLWCNLKGNVLKAGTGRDVFPSLPFGQCPGSDRVRVSEATEARGEWAKGTEVLHAKRSAGRVFTTPVPLSTPSPSLYPVARQIFRLGIGTP